MQIFRDLITIHGSSLSTEVHIGSLSTLAMRQQVLVLKNNTMFRKINLSLTHSLSHSINQPVGKNQTPAPPPPPTTNLYIPPLLRRRPQQPFHFILSFSLQLPLLLQLLNFT